MVSFKEKSLPVPSRDGIVTIVIIKQGKVESWNYRTVFLLITKIVESMKGIRHKAEFAMLSLELYK